MVTGRERRANACVPTFFAFMWLGVRALVLGYTILAGSRSYDLRHVAVAVAVLASSCGAYSQAVQPLEHTSQVSVYKHLRTRGAWQQSELMLGCHHPTTPGPGSGNLSVS
jgi:hypothetical protein